MFFFSLLFFIYASSEDPVINPKEWTPESLYKYVSQTFLNQHNLRLQQNFNHMIVDPENYLQYADLGYANQYMDILYNKYNISSHIFFISNMKSKFKLNEEIPEFVSKLSYLMYKNYDEYDEIMTLTAVFFIKDRKMRIQTSRNLREIISDYDSFHILNRRKIDLKKHNYQEVVNGLIKDIYNTFKSRIENNNESFDNNLLTYTIIFIVIIAILLFLFNQEKPSKQEDKMKVFLDKLKKKNNLKEMFTESCMICLEDFLSEDKIKEFEKVDKEKFEKEETSVLECGHKFHRKCIADWLKKEANCPFCRMKFNIKRNDNKDNKSTNVNDININFGSILTEILRIQSDINMLNDRQIHRIRKY